VTLADCHWENIYCYQVQSQSADVQVLEQLKVALVFNQVDQLLVFKYDADRKNRVSLWFKVDLAKSLRVV
jgi:hypothetical protein